MEQDRHFITCYIAGVLSDPCPSIPVTSLREVEMAIAGMRILLTAFGDYVLREIPQFCDGGLLLEMAPLHPAGSPINASRFDQFVRNVAEYMDAKIERRDPLLTHDNHGRAPEEIENICRSLTGLGAISLRIDAMPIIELRCRRQWRNEGQQVCIRMEVAMARQICGLEGARGNLLVPSEVAETLRPGDVISIGHEQDMTQIQRPIGMLVEVVEDEEMETADIFEMLDD